MPALRTCDQAARGQAYNVLSLYEDLGNGAVVSIKVLWVWDQVSVYPDCDGPLFNGGDGWAVRVVNTGTAPAYLHTTRKNGHPVTYTLAAGRTVNLTAAQAASGGYSTFSDFGSLTLTTTP